MAGAWSGAAEIASGLVSSSFVMHGCNIRFVQHFDGCICLLHNAVICMCDSSKHVPCLVDSLKHAKKENSFFFTIDDKTVC